MVSDVEPTGRPAGPRRRVVFATYGSLGDLQPFVAMALGMAARGHEAILATSACHRERIEALGLGFRAVRPDSDWVDDPEVMRRIMELRWGSMRVLRELFLPRLRESYDDLLAAAEGADLLVSHPLAYATRLVSETTGIAWASTMIAPVGLYSAHDPPMLPGAPELSRWLRGLGPGFWDPFGRLLRRLTRTWARPWFRLRHELGLPPTTDVNPLVDGHSSALHLALFAPRLAAPQPDWPPSTVVTGFPFDDRVGGADLPPALTRFLEDGPPPLVFTLGCSASTVTGSFFEHSIAAAQGLGRRAVLVVGKNSRNRPASLPDGVMACDFAPYSALFPRAAAVVHHGGIGTTGLAMRSGRPMLVVPFAHDQPDNAERLARLGVARVLPQHRFTAPRATAELRRLLDDPAYARRAREVEAELRHEDGVRAACDALERLLAAHPPRS